MTKITTNPKKAQSTGEDSNASDDAGSDRDDDQMDGLNGSMDPRTSSFPGFLGLQGIPGLLPGPSGMHGDNFGKYQKYHFFISFLKNH